MKINLTSNWPLKCWGSVLVNSNYSSCTTGGSCAPSSGIGLVYGHTGGTYKDIFSEVLSVKDLDKATYPVACINQPDK